MKKELNIYCTHLPRRILSAFLAAVMVFQLVFVYTPLRTEAVGAVSAE